MIVKFSLDGKRVSWRGDLEPIAKARFSMWRTPFVSISKQAAFIDKKLGLSNRLETKVSKGKASYRYIIRSNGDGKIFAVTRAVKDAAVANQYLQNFLANVMDIDSV
jgi:hypothetical protein